VIGVQDNAADELRRVRARRPHDAAERRDRRAQLGRVGSRERNARDEMRRLRGEARRFQYGGGIGRQMGGIDSLPRPLTGLTRPTIMRMPSGVQGQPWPGGEPPPNQSGVAYPRPRMGALPNPLGSPRVPPMQPPRGMNDYQRMGLEPWRGQQGQPNIPQGMLRSQAQSGQIGSPQQFRPPRPPIDQQTLARMAAAQRPRGGFNAPPSLVGQSQGRGIAPVQRGSSPKPWFSSTQRPEYLPETQAQFVPWARGGRVGLKTGGRIPRKKGAKFI
jgi:hypothetical protein